MKLQIPQDKSTTVFNLDTFIEQNKDLKEILSKYVIQQVGSSVFIYLKDSQSLVAHFNSFDNTLLILQPQGFSIADAFGSKRFPLGAGRQELLQVTAAKVNAIEFKRDLQFPLISPKREPKIAYKAVNFPQLLLARKDISNLYAELAELFNRCSDYTTLKKQEFLAGGALEDKFCRFNRDNQKTQNGVCTINTFLVDEMRNNKVVGTQSATIVQQPNREVDIYLYDEVVDYYILLTSEEIQEYRELCDNKPELSEEDKATPIIVHLESKREELLSQLFAITREKIKVKLRELLPDLDQQQIDQMILDKKIRAIIRAAPVWYPYSARLNCVPNPDGVFVIHGKRTDLGDYVDKQIKNWATAKLKPILEANSYPVSPELNKKWPRNVYDEMASAQVQLHNADDHKDAAKSLGKYA